MGAGSGSLLKWVIFFIIIIFLICVLRVSQSLLLNRSALGSSSVQPGLPPRAQNPELALGGHTQFLSSGWNWGPVGFLMGKFPSVQRQSSRRTLGKLRVGGLDRVVSGLQ